MSTTSQEKIGQAQLSEVGRSNLEKNAELWRAESIFVKLEDSEKRVLQFDPAIICFIIGIPMFLGELRLIGWGAQQYTVATSTETSMDKWLRDTRQLYHDRCLEYYGPNGTVRPIIALIQKPYL
jgi:hypothetical protein